MIWTLVLLAAVTLSLAAAKLLGLVGWDWWVVVSPAAAVLGIQALIWVGAVVRWGYQIVSGDRTKVDD